MKCQKCGANNANTHVKTVINGEIKEYDLCSECAKKMGYTNIFGNFEDEFSGLLGSFFGNSLPARTQATRCDFCGSSYSDIAKSGHVGCAKCYEIFGDSFFLQSEESTATQPIAVRTAVSVQRKPKRVPR